MTQHPERRKFVPTPLHPKTPVPADIDIAQAATLKPIRQVAEEMGLEESELELYGDYKAKIKLEVLDRLADRDEQVDPLPHRQTTGIAVGGERFALDQFHGEEGQPVGTGRVGPQKSNKSQKIIIFTQQT